MHLDKTKLRQLIEKTRNLTIKPQNGFYSVSNVESIKPLGSVLSGLSGWLTKHPNLTNGASYGRKLSELKTKLTPSNKYAGSYLSIEELDTVRTGILNLLGTIDRENKSIFIVHGRDSVMRDAVEKALHGLGLPTVILGKEDDNGQTVIEKFVKEAARCEYAVVLCSADDEGRLRAKGRNKDTPFKLRARQNVVLELGYFLALLDRKNVFVLYPEESIEQASDFAGVVYQVFDKAGSWKQKLVRELKAAGFKIPVRYSDRL